MIWRFKTLGIFIDFLLVGSWISISNFYFKKGFILIIIIGYVYQITIRCLIPENPCIICMMNNNFVFDRE